MDLKSKDGRVGGLLKGGDLSARHGRSKGPLCSCSEECHEKLFDGLILEYGEFKRVEEKRME